MRLRETIRAGDALAELLPALAQPESAAGALRKIAELGDVRALPHLAPFVVTTSASLRHAALHAVALLMPRDPLALAKLETHIRASSAYAHHSWWPQGSARIDPYVAEPVARTAMARRLPLPALGLLSLNANGRVRELATKGLAELAHREAIAFLLLRVNDWVPQVADVARRAVMARCVPQEARHFVPALPLIERLATQQRVDNSVIVAAVSSLLTQTDPGTFALVAALKSETPRHTRRAVVRLLRSGGVSLEPFEHALRDPDPIVRTQLALALIERSEGAVLSRRLPMLLSDRSARIRSLAFHAAAARAPHVLQAALPMLLFDSNFWLREYARQKLGLSKQVAAKLYASAVMEQDSRLISALAGLGEVGTEQDAAVLLEHTSYGSSGKRQVALRALFNVLKAKAVPALIAALASDWAGVSKVAAELLQSRGLIVFAEDVAACLGDPAPFTRANALRVLAKVDRWEALLAALNCASDPDSRVVATAERILSGWRVVPASFGSPPRARQRERLLAALAAAPPAATSGPALVGPAELDQIRKTVRAML